MTDEMHVHVLSTGAMETDSTWLLLKGGHTIRDRHHKDDPAGWGDCPTHGVLIEHPDTSLAQLELTPNDIDILVLSHLHFDHAANAKMFDNGRTRIIANSNEIEGALGIEGYSRGAHILSNYDGLTFDAVSGATEIVPGVSVIETPGHTWGTMSLRIDLLDEGSKIFTSDAVYLGESWGPPAVGAAIVWDDLRWLESVEKLRSIADKTGAEVIFGHDAKQAKTLRYAPTTTTAEPGRKTK